MDRYDSIVIGAGHNGLVCAAYLARSGRRVLLLEASESLGGLAAAREFHPGFHASVAHSVGHFAGKIVRDLDLKSHGLQAAPQSLPLVGLGTDGIHVIVGHGSVTGSSNDDSDAYEKYSRLMRRFAKALGPFWLKTIPTIGNNSLSEMMTFTRIGLGMLRLGKDDMREFLRVISLPARDLMDECFDNELLKATLSWDGLIGSKLAPRSPNGAVLAMLYRMAEESDDARVAVAGGVKNLVESLRNSALSSGVDIRNRAEVDRIVVEGSSGGLIANGIRLKSGETISAKEIISAVDPQRTFLSLVGVEHLNIGFTNRIRRLRCDGYVAKLHLALSSLPKFDGLGDLSGRMIIAPNMDAIEFAFDDAKYLECATRPVMELVVPSIHDASLAPDGQHVLSAHVMYVPYRLKGGWNDAARDLMRERAIDSIAQYAPRIREHIVQSELLTPADLDHHYRVTGGHWHHTEFAMDQMLMMRPTYEAAQYSTPIPGLYLCGAGCHPGGDIMGGAGHNAAQEILR